MADRQPDETVTVVIPTRDRPDDLERVLASLVPQSHADFSVLVMDQSADAGPARRMIELLGDDRFVHVDHRKTGKSVALNDAINTTTAEIIAFTDDDCEVPGSWIEQGLSTLRSHPSVGLLFGEVVAADLSGVDGFIPAIHFDAAREIRGPVSRHRDLLGMGANMFIRRTTFGRIGLFDEDLGPGGRLRAAEEAELTYRILQDGHFAVMQDPTLTLDHYGLRRTDDGTAHQHLVIADYGRAAGLGKHLRTLDRKAMRVLLDEIGWRIGVVARSVLRARRPLNLGYLTTFARGLIAGLRAGPAWPPAQPSTQRTEGSHA